MEISKTSRRKFIKKSAVLGLSFMAFKSFAESPVFNIASGNTGYGELIRDPKGIVNLPKGFSYRMISKAGEMMDDGLVVPGLHDGTAAFEGSDENEVILIRNHELDNTHPHLGAFGNKNAYLSKIDRSLFYDYGGGQKPALGGTTTIIYNEKTGEVKRHYMSLFGTMRNCAGGKTPWNTWITCEESVVKADGVLEKDHGYNFEVKASSTIDVSKPVPLREMGRFNHEAVAVDPKTGIVYQTEDRNDSLIYRFIPNKYGKLSEGGRLQCLAVKDQSSMDTRNWNQQNVILNRQVAVEWIDLDNVESPEDDLRFRGFAKGAALFARGEGAWFGDNEFYFACTNGGGNKTGQVFRYIPSPYEGRERENERPGKLELFAESKNKDIMKSCDNLTIAPWGDIVLCEDDPHPFLVGITRQGEYYKLGENVGFKSEFSGANFSPSGKTLFVNIQGPGITLAITGPWKLS